MRLWPRRKSNEDDIYRPLSEREKEFVEREVHAQPKGGGTPAAATPDAPINAGEVSGPDLGLSEAERELAQREVDEQLGHNPRP
jgi:hypothetical protein